MQTAHVLYKQDWKHWWPRSIYPALGGLYEWAYAYYTTEPNAVTWLTLNDLCQMTCARWHMSDDMCQMTCARWHVSNDICQKTYVKLHVPNSICWMAYVIWHMSNDMCQMTCARWHASNDIIYVICRTNLHLLDCRLLPNYVQRFPQIQDTFQAPQWDLLVKFYEDHSTSELLHYSLTFQQFYTDRCALRTHLLCL